MAQQFEHTALIFCLILVIYILTSHFIQVKKIFYLHESAVAILMGFLTAIFLKYALEVNIKFNNDIFFTIILPPIIFSAGYSLRKSLFFQNLGIISFLGIIGTIIGFTCISFFLWVISKYFFADALTLGEIMMLSSVLCATDTVAAMALIKPQKYPTLNAVLFGEGIINDAVAIILFRTVQQLKLDQPGNTFSLGTVFDMAFSFSYLFFCSLALGLVTGFGISYLFKINQSFNRYPLKEASLILLNGYTTYLIGQQFRLSGIISLFTCAIIMGHYCFWNISMQSQRGTGLAFQTVSYIAEGFIFAYLGASILSISTQWMAVGMSCTVLLCFPFVRATMVYVLPIINKCRRKKPFPLNSKELKICWYSGMVRGVIAFALCLQIQTEHKDFMTTITAVIVMLTTLGGALLLKAFARCIKLQTDEQDEQNGGNLRYSIMPENIQRNEGITQEMVLASNYQNLTPQLNNEYKSQNFQKFEKEYIKPFFKRDQTRLTYQIEEQSKISSTQAKNRKHSDGL